MKSTVSVISSMATRALLAELIDLWRAEGGGPVSVESIGGVDAARRVASGEPFDVVVLAADAIDRLVTAGHAVAETRTDLAHSHVAIAARSGAAHPAIDSAEALRTAVLAAPRIALSTGPSGKAIQQLVERWGIADALHDRLVQAPPGIPVGKLIAEGSADLGFQQLSELQELKGIDVLGTMPPGLEIVTTFSGVFCRSGADRAEAMRLLAFWSSPATAEAKRRHGMSPAQ